MNEFWKVGSWLRQQSMCLQCGVFTVSLWGGRAGGREAVFTRLMSLHTATARPTSLRQTKTPEIAKWGWIRLQSNCPSLGNLQQKNKQKLLSKHFFQRCLPAYQFITIPLCAVCCLLCFACRPTIAILTEGYWCVAPSPSPYQIKISGNSGSSTDSLRPPGTHRVSHCTRMTIQIWKSFKTFAI